LFPGGGWMIGPEARRGSLGGCAGAAGAAVSAPLPGVPAASFLRSDFLRFGAGVAASAGGAGLAVSAAGTAPASAAGLNRALVGAGIGVSALAPVHESLEDVFLEVIGGA